ncbi:MULTISPECIES: DNA-3-methyladenine glycosylase family protein [unclassified Companilactobacillus]|uniref:DNA-3-methyladenine glycosylase family protein n=1 Tax=unclassified Companilactobacillus TaxID=2767904 RepID=UPI002FEFF7DC
MVKNYYFDKNSPEIIYLTKKDKHLAKVIDMTGPLQYQLISDPYHFLVHEIIEQMLSKKVALILDKRLTLICQGEITPQKITQLTDKEIHQLGISKSKVSYIRNLTIALIQRKLDFKSLNILSDKQIIQTLTQIKGIGNWSAKMYLIFSLDRRDVLPFEDGAFLESFRWVYKPKDSSVKLIQKKCQKWHPYTSIAARFLYKAQDLGLTKTTFHLFK